MTIRRIDGTSPWRELPAPAKAQSTPGLSRARDAFDGPAAQRNVVIDSRAVGGPASAATASDREHPPAPGTRAFEEKLDGLTHSNARDGNRVQLLLDGVNSFAERNRLIDGAKSSINLQTFIFTDDDTGWELARRLARKAEEGVKVRVIYDGMGSNRSGNKIFDFMRQHGVEVREYGDPLRQFWDVNDRWHEKHLIVDGKVSIEGGMNIADEYALGGTGKSVLSRGAPTEAWRDVDARVEGPAVADAQRAFLRNWNELGSEIPGPELDALFPPLGETGGGSWVRVVQHRPDEDGDQNTQQLYLQAIRSARESITIENAYFVPPKELRRALIDAAKRGVEVKVLTNSRTSSDMGVVSDAARYFYDDLIGAGVRIYEKEGGTLHSKTATFDGVYSIVGSVNLNGRSRGRDSETALAVGDPEIAAGLQARFASGLSQAKEVTAKELRSEGFFTNLQQFSLSLLAWTF